MMGDQWLVLYMCLLVVFSYATPSFASVTDCQMLCHQILKSSFPSKMSSETATCPGCDHKFSLQGYQSHLVLSQDPLCYAIFNRLKKANDAYKLFMSANKNSRSGASSDTDHNAVLFQDNAFGTAKDYASNMFRQIMDDNEVNADDLPPLMEVSDDD